MRIAVRIRPGSPKLAGMADLAAAILDVICTVDSTEAWLRWVWSGNSPSGIKGRLSIMSGYLGNESTYHPELRPYRVEAHCV